MLLTYWTDKVPVAAVVVACLVIYAYVRLSPKDPTPNETEKKLTFSSSVLNGLTVRYFGISEFYMSIFKVFLMLGLISYTFVTMVGGNPRRDPYGFRYWNDPVCDPFLILLPFLLFPIADKIGY